MQPPHHENRTFAEPDTLTIELADRLSSSPGVTGADG
jgi:hypothetical protein